MCSIQQGLRDWPATSCNSARFVGATFSFKETAQSQGRHSESALQLPCLTAINMDLAGSAEQSKCRSFH